MAVEELGIVQPQITALGKTFVEDFGSSISRYESRSRPPAGQTVVNFGGPVHGQVAIGNRNKMHQSHGTSGADLAQLVQNVLEAARGAGVEEKVARRLSALQLEVDEDDPDPDTVNKTLVRSTRSQSAAAAPR